MNSQVVFRGEGLGRRLLAQDSLVMTVALEPQIWGFSGPELEGSLRKLEESLRNP